METSELVVDAQLRTDVVAAVLRRLGESYIFPEVAAKLEEVLRKRLQDGDYDEITSGAELSEVLTAHLQEISHDKALRLSYCQTPQTPAPATEQRERWHQTGALTNFGFVRVERLPGNVGYLELRSFFPAEAPGASETALFAMSFLANTSALIIDLRQNGGGAMSMIALLASYLFDEAIHLTSYYGRAGDLGHELWTSTHVPGRRYDDKPVYVLTSSRTGGGAEDFTYALKSVKRVMSVGEVTLGTAHPGRPVPLTTHFTVQIPSLRAVSPSSGTNWEGTGITPDVETPAERALTAAHAAALKHVLEDAKNHQSPPPALVKEAEAELAKIEESSQWTTSE